MVYWTVRHPVDWGCRGYPGDVQDLPPMGWCVRCGGEVWEAGKARCRWCGGVS